MWHQHTRSFLKCMKLHIGGTFRQMTNYLGKKFIKIPHSSLPCPRELLFAPERLSLWCSSFPAWVSLSGLTCVPGLIKISVLPSYTKKMLLFLSGSVMFRGIGWCWKVPTDGMAFQSGHEVTSLIHSVSTGNHTSANERCWVGSSMKCDSVNGAVSMGGVVSNAFETLTERLLVFNANHSAFVDLIAQPFQNGIHLQWHPKHGMHWHHVSGVSVHWWLSLERPTTSHWLFANVYDYPWSRGRKGSSGLGKGFEWKRWLGFLI